MEKVNTTTSFTTKELFEIINNNLDTHTLINNEACNLCRDYS